MKRFTGFSELDEELLDENGDMTRRAAPEWSDDRLAELLGLVKLAEPKGSYKWTDERGYMMYDDNMFSLYRQLGNTVEFVAWKIKQTEAAAEREAQVREWEARQRAKEAAEKAAKIEAEMPPKEPLPTLIGTEKQIAWATQIREQAQLAQPDLPELQTATRAAWWIENRNRWTTKSARVSNEDLALSGRQDDLERLKNRADRRAWRKSDY